MVDWASNSSPIGTGTIRSEKTFHGQKTKSTKLNFHHFDFRLSVHGLQEFLDVATGGPIAFNTPGLPGTTFEFQGSGQSTNKPLFESKK